MTEHTIQAGLSQVVEPARKTMGKERGKSRVKPRHLSRLAKELVRDQFIARGSTEDVAEAMGLPSRTVTDILLDMALRRTA